MSPGHNNALGDYGQLRAERFLVGLGMVVLDRNWRCVHGELDLVLHDGPTLVACEVKTRTDTRFGHPLAAITPEKYARLRRLIAVWAATEPSRVRWDGIRIDAVGVLRPLRGPTTIQYAKGVC
ncbi:MAG TPA: YraN family protein [Marmoricola sp.]|nr:YraN family protein [Marmoricola sp.]HNI70791.1 YraN family protein [Marmoricola sp.]